MEFERAVAPAALLRAFERARRAKRGIGGEPAFYFELERNLHDLSAALLARTWRPAPYRYFVVRHTKERVVAEASFADRIVHHALMAALEPAWEARFIANSYACRRGKGQHLAVQSAADLTARHRFALRLDIHHYFAHVEHTTLIDCLRAGGADLGALWLAQTILAAAGDSSQASSPGVGIPIGNLTSQFWANVYLHDADKQGEQLVGGDNYLRYMDDFALFADDKAVLWRAHAAIDAFVHDRRGLALKVRATSLAPTSEGVAWLGLRLFPSIVRRQHPGRKRLFGKLAACHQRASAAPLAEDAESPRARALCGHLGHRCLLGLRRAAVAASDPA
ncbi:MAG: hypothetical protein EXR77_17945 [Myxococcales bacterium]|nr:hypothetical protein [Myxococcales bacterium]